MTRYRISEDGTFQRKVDGNFIDVFCPSDHKMNCNARCASWEVVRDFSLIRCRDCPQSIPVSTIDDKYRWLKPDA